MFIPVADEPHLKPIVTVHGISLVVAMIALWLLKFTNAFKRHLWPMGYLKNWYEQIVILPIRVPGMLIGPKC